MSLNTLEMHQDTCFSKIKIALKKIKCICASFILNIQFISKALGFDKFAERNSPLFQFCFQSQNNKALSFFNIHSCFFIQVWFQNTLVNVASKKGSYNVFG